MSKKQRDIVFNKFGGKCSYCGSDLSGTRWHVDHANPVERKYEWAGGKLVQRGFHKPENDVIENMMPACASCNINKHSMDIEQFRSFIGRFIASLNRDSVQYKIAKRYGLLVETENPVVFYFEKHEAKQSA